ncbi:MAG: TspO/MBR family protein [Thermohalobaculum sp.]|nr:TspO/MBR family protein [Thermohalobaculum sp.]
MDVNAALALAVFIGANVATAASGAIFKPGAWYEGLNHPSFRPPNWLFGPVWTVLYCMIAAAGYLVWRETGWIGGAFPLAIYFGHLVINFGWSYLFFGARRPDWAFFEVIGLWLSIVATIAVFAPISETAAWLLAPYLAWVSFAAFLNWTLWRLNPQAAGGDAGARG